MSVPAASRDWDDPNAAPPFPDRQLFGGAVQHATGATRAGHTNEPEPRLG